MKICSLSIENFGKLHRYDLTLQGGLNTLCQENGWGKTTLAAFLKAMFYGLPKSGKKDLDENDYKRFTPWQGGPFGGTMEFTCQKGRFRVERTFGEAESFALYDTASGLASSAFSENLGEELFGHFGELLEQGSIAGLATDEGLVVFSGFLAVHGQGVLALLGTPDNIIDMSVQYMRICCLGVIAIALYNCIASILRGLGDSRTPLYFLIVASVLNVVLDLVFVCVFHWGVAGAGVATIISQLLSGVGSLTLSIRRNAYFHLTKESFRFNRNIIFQTVRIGVPMAAQSSLIAFSCVILQSVVNSFGSSVVAAFTATSRVEQLVQQPYMSLSTAISTFTGQNIGAGKKDRVRLGASRGLIMILAFTCVMMPLIWIFSHPIIGLFVTDKEVIRLGAHALHSERVGQVVYIRLESLQ